MSSPARPSVLFAVLAMIASPSIAFAQVKVAKQPAVVERKTFDPKNRASEMPDPPGNEDGVTVAKFEVKTQVGFTPGTSKQDTESGRVTANIRTQQLELALSLRIEIWLPEGASDKLKAHEEGHRRIIEDVYKTADKTGRTVGQTYIGRGSTGTGANVKAAQTEALRELMRSLADDYMAATEQRAARINEIYDELTAHGTQAEPAEDAAIKEAVAQYAKEEIERKKQGRKGK